MMRQWPGWMFATLWVVMLGACGGSGGDRVECTDISQCGGQGSVCFQGFCAEASEVRVSASASAAGAEAIVLVLDPSGTPCAASTCKDLAYGAKVTFRAPPVPGFRFVGWSGSAACTGSEPELVIPMLTDDARCVASYARRVMVRGTVAGEQGGVQALSDHPSARCEGGGCEVDARTPVRLIVDQRWGERFTGWSGAGCGDGRSPEIVVQPESADVTCVASFVGRIAVGGRAMNVDAPITVSSSTPNAACEPGSCLIDRGGAATLSAPLVRGFRFAGWSGTPSCVGVDPTLTLASVQDSQLCIATYLRRVNVRGSAAGAEPPPVISAQSPDGYAACEGAGCEIDAGGSVTLIAGSAPGHRLTGWSGPQCDGKTSAAIALANVESDVACVANYALGIAVLGGVIDAPGEVIASSTWPGASCSAGGCVIDRGGSATLTAPTIEGYSFMGWEGDPGCTGSSPTIELVQVVQSRTCYARYTPRFLVRGTSAPIEGGSVRASSPTPGAICNGPSCTIARNGEVALEATPAANYRFSGWSGGPCTGAAPIARIVGVASNTTCQANFIGRLTVTGVAAPEGGGTVAARSDAGAASCMGATCAVDQGSRVALVATPTVGFQFVGWTDCGGSSAPVLTIDDVRTSRVCRAAFAPLRYTVTASSTPPDGGSVTASATGGNPACVPGACTVDFGASVTLTATPATGFQLASWSCSESRSPVLVRDNVRANQTCQATFTRVVLTVMASAGTGGTVSLATTSPGASCPTATSCSVPYGGAVTATATPQPNYRFASWMGCATGATNPLTLDVRASTACQASFERNTVIVTGTPIPTAGGTVTGASVDGPCTPTAGATRCTIGAGGGVSLTATAAMGYRFTGWTGCQPSSANPLVLTNLVAAASCQAGFEQLPFPVTATAMPPEGGAVTVSTFSPGTTCMPGVASCQVPPGGSVTFRAAPLNRYTFGAWSAGCTPSAADPLVATASNVAGPVACTATFVPPPPSFSVFWSTAAFPVGTTPVGTVVAQGTGCGLLPSRCDGVPQGSTVVLTAMLPDANTQVTWTGAGCIPDASDARIARVTVTSANVSCVATFTPRPMPDAGTPTTPSMASGAIRRILNLPLLGLPSVDASVPSP